jgi:hypothetical protein
MKLKYLGLLSYCYASVWALAYSMSSEQEIISADDAFVRQRVQVADGVEMAYIDTESGATPNLDQPLLVFMHGMPMSSYLWRNIIPHVQSRARCVAPDLMGFGASQKLPSEGYGWHNNVQYLDSFCTCHSAYIIFPVLCSV